MEWADEGIVLGVKRHGESSAILEAMTPRHGRHLGLVLGGRSRKQRPVLQPGNSVSLVWRARLEEQLGSFTLEGTTLRAGRLMESAAALNGLGLLAAHLRLLPERDPHPVLYEALALIVDQLDAPAEAGAAMVRFELLLLTELGFGLDLASCAATGLPYDLAYVSPKSGRAVCAEAGAPYRDALLPLPRFLTAGYNDTPTRTDLAAGVRLTGFFLSRHLYEASGQTLPDGRDRFIDTVMRVLPTHDPSPIGVATSPA